MLKNYLTLAVVLSGITFITLISGCGREPEKSSVAQPNAKVTKSMLRADSDMQTLLNKFASFHGKAIEKSSVDEAREQPTMADAVKGVLADQKRDSRLEVLVPSIMTREIQIPGAVSSMPATVYTPEGAGPFPVVLYFHGGGWVLADRHVYDGGARGLAKQANAVVVSVDYRLAPENKFPAAHDDALAAYRWLTTEASSVKGDPKRLALAGESAGGNLAVATAVAAHKAGLTTPRHLLSIYPVTQSSTTTESYLKYADAIPLNRRMMLWFILQTTTSQADTNDTRIDLVRANLQGLPPVTLINAEIDPLRDDGAQLEQALRSAGVSVERRLYSGVTHEFFGAAAILRKAQEAQAYAGGRLKADLSK